MAKSAAQWLKQYMQYLSEWSKAHFTSKGKLQAKYETTATPLSLEKFKTYYYVSLETLKAEGKSSANVYRELVKYGPERSGPYTLSKKSAKALQQKLNEAEKSKPVKERHYYTIKEVRLLGGKMASEVNDMLKEEHPEWNSYERAHYISEEIYGSP